MRVKLFLFISILLLTGDIALYHILQTQRDTTALRTLTTLTHLPDISLSTPFFENRNLLYDTPSTGSIYPDIYGYRTMDFIYVP